VHPRSHSRDELPTRVVDVDSLTGTLERILRQRLRADRQDGELGLGVGERPDRRKRDALRNDVADAAAAGVERTFGRPLGEKRVGEDSTCRSAILAA